METNYGPQLEVCDQLHADKYRQEHEGFPEVAYRLAGALCDDEEHRKRIKDIFLSMRFMPAGRIQSVVGSARLSTPFNCYVSGVVEDSMSSIMQRNIEAAETMRQGGGIGFDYSLLRPENDIITSLQSRSSGPVSFAEIPNAICKTIAAAGHRRGAMMLVLRVDHPDIEKFISAKQAEGVLTNFNVSVGITDAFMEAVKNNDMFPLTFLGKTYKMVSAKGLWDEIMRATWNWAEPGVLFLDTINKENNLNYCETISATNPCGEQPLPPFGACLLGSFNLTKYIYHCNERPEYVHVGRYAPAETGYVFDYQQFANDIPDVVRAIDNVIDDALFPLPEQAQEAQDKRRMGLGITGLGNALTALGLSYGSPEGIKFLEDVMYTLRHYAYLESIELAKEKGAFPAFTEEYLNSPYIKRLSAPIQEGIKEHGIRNSHLISIAPAGTISFCADNCSSGLEPAFAHTLDRPVRTPDGVRTVRIEDYALHKWGLKGETTADLSVDAHLDMLLAAAPYVDSAISKTINIGDSVTFNEFKEVYMKAWEGGAKGCTTFRLAGKRFGLLKKVETEGAACFIDPETGQSQCG